MARDPMASTICGACSVAWIFLTGLYCWNHQGVAVIPSALAAVLFALRAAGR